MNSQPYPVSYDIERPEHYNRWTVAFRLILAIPHLILVGGGSFYYGGGGSQSSDDPLVQTISAIFSGGILTFIAGLLLIVAWFAILITARFPEGLQNFVLMVYRWSMNVHAYIMLQAASYPPFSGNQPYELNVQVTPAERHNRLTVFFRIIMAIPHFIVLAFLGIAQLVVTVIAWFAILFTGQYPEGMYRFSVGVSRWQARVIAYVYLFIDDYPPFSLDPQPGTGTRMAPAT